MYGSEISFDYKLSEGSKRYTYICSTGPPDRLASVSYFVLKRSCTKIITKMFPLFIKSSLHRSSTPRVSKNRYHLILPHLRLFFAYTITLLINIIFTIVNMNKKCLFLSRELMFELKLLKSSILSPPRPVFPKKVG